MSIDRQPPDNQSVPLTGGAALHERADYLKAITIHWSRRSQAYRIYRLTRELTVISTNYPDLMTEDTKNKVVKHLLDAAAQGNLGEAAIIALSGIVKVLKTMAEQQEIYTALSPVAAPTGVPKDVSVAAATALNLSRALGISPNGLPQPEAASNGVRRIR